MSWVHGWGGGGDAWAGCMSWVHEWSGGGGAWTGSVWLGY